MTGRDVAECGVYRAYDAAGDLLYIGISHDPHRRIVQHQRSQPWGSVIAAYQIEWLPTEEAARFVERYTVGRENPPHNKQLTSDFNRALAWRAREPARGRQDARTSVVPWAPREKSAPTVAEHVARLVAATPPIPLESLDRITALLRPHVPAPANVTLGDN